MLLYKDLLSLRLCKAFVAQAFVERGSSLGKVLVVPMIGSVCNIHKKL
ncbi:hypothetical protein HMPREF3192_00893 [Atopobium deltae]|uniref:Uncharacterized protein n=1 Tax=Atopobium deltae TaxID=1393034 RepID=A0A133XTU6_9ACTN|nr:hypothetical protein HMPREF3192_00893 [Atopobium deltae]